MPTRHATEDFVPATPTPPRSEDTRDPPRPHSKAHNYYNETYDDDLYESPSRYANPRHMYSHGEPGTPLGRNYDHRPSRVPDAPPRSPVMRLASGNHRKITARLQPRSNSRLPKSLALTPPDNKKPRSWVSISSGSSNPRYHSSTRQKKTQAHDTELQELQELIKDLKTEYRRLHQRTESKVDKNHELLNNLNADVNAIKEDIKTLIDGGEAQRVIRSTIPVDPNREDYQNVQFWDEDTYTRYKAPEGVNVTKLTLYLEDENGQQIGKTLAAKITDDLQSYWNQMLIEREAPKNWTELGLKRKDDFRLTFGGRYPWLRLGEAGWKIDRLWIDRFGGWKKKHPTLYGKPANSTKLSPTPAPDPDANRTTPPAINQTTPNPIAAIPPLIPSPTNTASDDFLPTQATAGSKRGREEDDQTDSDGSKRRRSNDALMAPTKFTNGSRPAAGKVVPRKDLFAGLRVKATPAASYVPLTTAPIQAPIPTDGPSPEPTQTQDSPMGTLPSDFPERVLPPSISELIFRTTNDAEDSLTESSSSQTATDDSITESSSPCPAPVVTATPHTIPVPKIAPVPTTAPGPSGSSGPPRNTAGPSNAPIVPIQKGKGKQTNPPPTQTDNNKRQPGRPAYRAHILAKWQNDPDFLGNPEKHWRSLGEEERAIEVNAMRIELGHPTPRKPKHKK